MARYQMTVLLLLVCMQSAWSQELFVYSEPASNMPARSLGLRATGNGMTTRPVNGASLMLVPELMAGINKNLMVHAEGYFSNNAGRFRAEGAGGYAKYRFYSSDAVNRHFRMAVFARASINSSQVYHQEIETNGRNSGYELGWIGTQLLHRQAISASLGYEAVWGVQRKALSDGKAINYTLSTGRLLLPRNYLNYRQPNLNLMLELLGQYQPGSGRSFLDIAPAVQVILNSQTRIDAGYRQQLYSHLSRTMANGFLIRVEHTLFNTW